ncbi:hypothetical protein [Shewanella sp.]|uniref:hypothetical protein n=1 Tax=Shewanella sp. TaxID=50422 RepID=UPI003A977A8F
MISKLLLGLAALLLSQISSAAELTQVGQKASAKAQQQVRDTELQQLEKAKAAANDTHAREQVLLQQQTGSPWQAAEQAKAQQQFNERKQREAKYLQEAQAAAAKEQKMDKPKMKIIKRKTED